MDTYFETQPQLKKYRSSRRTVLIAAIAFVVGLVAGMELSPGRPAAAVDAQNFGGVAHALTP